MYFIARLRFFIALFTLTFFHSAHAMRAEYIQVKLSHCGQWDSALTVVRNRIDSRTSGFPLSDLPDSVRDSLADIARNTYDALPVIRSVDISLPDILLKSILLLFVGEAGTRAAFDQALSLLGAASTRFPQSPQIPWMRGILLVKRGNLFNGLMVLDSLRVSGFEEDEFLSDYARVFFYSVMPKKKKSASHIMIRNAAETQPTDTVNVRTFKWNIITSRKAKYPFFQYEASFAFRKQFTLESDGFFFGENNAALLSFGSRRPLSTAAARVLRQLSDRIDSAWCAIHIDVNDTAASPFEYLLKRINGIYDTIAIKSDLRLYNALSLRCYSMGGWGREATVTAYIVFDRFFGDIARAALPSKRLSQAEATRRIRFTVTMRSGLSVESQAEAKLQSIISDF